MSVVSGQDDPRYREIQMRYFVTAGAAMSAALSCMAAPATAQEQSRFSVGVTGGTLGIGPEVSVQASRKIGLRASATFLSVSKEFEGDSLTYDGTAKLKSGGVMVDFRPSGGGFRLSAGARINGNRATAVATPAAPVDIDGTLYTPAQVGTVTGGLDFKNLAPMLTLGYSDTHQGLRFSLDAGAMFQGNPRVQNFTASGGGVSAADLAAERDSVQQDVDGYKVWPVLQIGLGYNF